MSDRSVIVVTVDGLGASMLGPYGNSWVSTPGFDRLAAESLVVEHALVDSHQLDVSFRSYWQGRHAACAEKHQASLAQLCLDRGLTPILLSDHDAVLSHACAAGFQKSKLVIPEPTEAAITPEETVTARFFDQALRKMPDLHSPFLLWIHAMGFARAWDCPTEMREALVDESDPELAAVLAPPRHRGDPLDADVAWGLRVAYGAQLNLLDACLHVFLEQLRAACRSDGTLTMVTSPRAYPLAEHRVVGNAEPVLHSEQLHVPLIIRGLNDDMEPQRTQAICQSACVFGTIDRWLSLGAGRNASGAFAMRLDADASETCWQCAVAVSGDRGVAGLRTPAWYFRYERDSATPLKLYAKPDDRWEFNEVADRAPEVIAAAQSELSQFLEMATADRLDRLPPLPDSLRTIA